MFKIFKSKLDIAEKQKKIPDSVVQQNVQNMQVQFGLCRKKERQIPHYVDVQISLKIFKSKLDIAEKQKKIPYSAVLY